MYFELLLVVLSFFLECFQCRYLTIESCLELTRMEFSLNVPVSNPFFIDVTMDKDSSTIKTATIYHNTTWITNTSALCWEISTQNMDTVSFFPKFNLYASISIYGTYNNSYISYGIISGYIFRYRDFYTNNNPFFPTFANNEFYNIDPISNGRLAVLTWRQTSMNICI